MPQSTKIEGLTPYQDFIVSIIKLEKEIKKEHKGEARFADFKLVDLLYKYREENAEINKRVLSLITKYGADEKSLEPLIEEIKRERKNRIDDKIKLREKEKDAVALIENYMLRYYNKYFRVIGGNVVKTDLMLYDYDDQDSYSKKLARSADNSLPIIVLPDGEAFFSATCHQDIASWLNASGKSLQGAVRIFLGILIFSGTFPGVRTSNGKRAEGVLKHCKFWLKNLPICPVVWYDSNEVLYLFCGYGKF